MTKREKGVDRRARLEAERAAQKSAQRKRNLLTAGIGLAIGAVIIGGTAFAIYNSEQDKPSNQPFSAFGVSQADADCGKVETEKVSGNGQHVGPGTDTPNVTTVKYSTVPPTSGQHFAVWLDPSTHFYSATDNPKVEQLVHNLEHGYNIVWYSPDLAADQVSDLQGIADKIGRDSDTRKFIVAPWNTSYGELPDDKPIGITHWGAKEGYRQLCGAVSGEAIAAFVADHPSTNAPEPNTP